MSWDKDGRTRCDMCGKYCSPATADSEIPFGCANPEDPEPYDPDHFCENCFADHKANWLKSFKEGSRYGYWEKSRAEQEAAKECGLIWVGDGIGTWNTPTYKHQTYVTKEEYEELKKLPKFVEKKLEEVWL